MTFFSIHSGHKERPLSAVPGMVLFILFAGLSAQLTWHNFSEGPKVSVKALPDVPETGTLRLFSLGDTIVMSKLLMLWLQAFDNQPGISIPFRELDYDKIIDWLEIILSLDNQAQYPLLAASRLYTQVADAGKQRKMLEFVARKFREDPARRWQWMAHAVYVAKHQLKDLALALHYARILNRYAQGEDVPPWARQMEIFVLEDMGELESAKVLIGGLLDSGTIRDANELRFLERRLQEIETRQSATAGQGTLP